MQRAFAIFLLAAMMCVSVCGCSNTPGNDQPPPPVETKMECRKLPYIKPASIPEKATYYEESDIELLAKLMYRECRGIPSTTQKACVAWTVLNRVDEYGKTIFEVVTAPNQFAYELYALAEDVLTRWNDERNGDEDVGRVLPTDYLWFSGDGKFNYFRNAYKGNFSIWDYSLTSPYES